MLSDAISSVSNEAFRYNQYRHIKNRYANLVKEYNYREGREIQKNLELLEIPWWWGYFVLTDIDALKRASAIALIDNKLGLRNLSLFNDFISLLIKHEEVGRTLIFKI